MLEAPQIYLILLYDNLLAVFSIGSRLLCYPTSSQGLYARRTVSSGRDRRLRSSFDVGTFSWFDYSEMMEEIAISFSLS